MFAGTLLACDMGGFFLAKGSWPAAVVSQRGYTPGLILGSMMGPTIVNTHSGGAQHYPEPRLPPLRRLAYWRVSSCIPIGCPLRGIDRHVLRRADQWSASGVYLRADLMNMIPVRSSQCYSSAGAEVHPRKMINGFQIFAKFLVALITIGLAANWLNSCWVGRVDSGARPDLLCAGATNPAK